MEFSLCLLFAKLVSYTFLYWLPLYIVNVGEVWEVLRRSQVEGSPSPQLAPHPAPLPAAHFGAKEAGDLSTLFDVGGILGLWCAWAEEGWMGMGWGQSCLASSVMESPLHRSTAARSIPCLQHSVGTKHTWL